MSVKQFVLLMTTVVVCLVPMCTLIFVFDDRLAPRLFGYLGAINMAISVPLITFVYRHWISKIK
ncbi:MAG: hypothetical protein ACRENQ_14225 [Gemmatimonadaceae bacterium]